MLLACPVVVGLPKRRGRYAAGDGFRNALDYGLRKKACTSFLRRAFLGGPAVYFGAETPEGSRLDDWVKVGSAPNETAALMMEGLLKNCGMPVLIRRGAGFDIPDFLSAGPRDVLVPDLYVEEARQLLEDTTGLGSWAP